MNFYAASALLTSLFSLISGFIVFIQNPRNKKNITFLLFTISIGVWSGCYTIWQMSTTAEAALFWARMLMLGCVFIPVTQYHHIVTLFDAQTPQRQKAVFGFYALAITICLFSFSPLFIPRVEPKLDFPFWPVPGFFIHILFASLGIPILGTVFLFREAKKKAAPLLRNQFNWHLLAIFIGFSGGLTNIPLWYDIPLRPYPTVLSSVMPITSALLFFKLGLFDMGLFFRRSLLFLVSCFPLALVSGGAVYLVTKNGLLSSCVFLAIFFFPPLFSAFRTWFETWLSQTSIWRETVALKSIDRSVEKIRETTYTYDDLAKNIVGSLLNTFPVETAAVYFYDLTRKELHLRAQKGMKNDLARDLKYNRTALAIHDSDPLMVHMLGKRTVVNREAFIQDQNTDTAPIKESMERIEAEICAPFLFQGKVKGLVVLGKKKNNTLFNTEDIDAIYAFTRMGEEIMRYIMGMESELRNTALYSHDMAHDVRSIIQTLEFIVSPMAEKQTREKLNQLINSAKKVAFRLSDTFQTNRDRSSLILKAVRGDYEKAPVDITRLIKESHGKFSLQAEKQNISFAAEIQESPSLVNGNSNDLIRAVDNLLGNALRYVATDGSISLKAKESDGFFQIDVNDNGMGIAAENLEKIWEMGWQSGEKKGAAGFGLSIVKQIVEMHQGTIAAASEGLTKGTTFTVKIPIYSDPTK